MDQSALLNQALGRRTRYKYVDLTQRIMRDMARRQLKAGDRLGTENELSEEYGLSRITVRQALAILEEDGFVLRKQKRGTFVRKSVESARDLMMIRGTVVVAIQNDLQLDPDQDLATFSLFRTLERELATQGFSLRVIGLGNNRQHDRLRLLKITGDEDVEGLCAIGPCLEPYRSVIDDLPLITTATFHPTEGVWVGLDMQEITYQSVLHLIDHGHRDIALMLGAWVDAKGAADFAKGHRRAMHERGLPYHREMFYHAFEDEALIDLAEQVLTGRNRPTAVFGDDWRVCHTLLSVAQQRHIDIPGDLSLIGCGRNVLGIRAPVAVTAFVPDDQRLGHTIAQVLTRMIDHGETPDQPIALSGHIVEQASVRRIESGS